MLSKLIAIACICILATTQATDDPRETLKQIMTAMAAQDAASLLAACDVPSHDERPYVEAVTRMMLAGRRLADTATAAFGPAGDSIAKGPIAAADEADIPHASVSVIGDTAELLMPGHTQPLRFRKVDGTWKFLVSDFAGSTARDLGKQTTLTQMFAAAMVEAAEEIEQGRYAQAADAEAAIRQKLNTVLMKSLTAAPATQPAK